MEKAYTVIALTYDNHVVYKEEALDLESARTIAYYWVNCVDSQGFPNYSVYIGEKLPPTPRNR